VEPAAAAQTSAEIPKSVDVPPVIVEPVKEPVAEPAAQKIAETPKSADVTPVIAEPVREPVREPVAEPAVSKTAETSERSGGFTGIGGFRTSTTNAGTDRPAGNYAPPAAFTGFSQRNDTDDANEITIISRNTIIDGNIRSFADMSINGDIRGDVETTKNIELNGKIVGNIICNNAFMHRSQIQGGIRMKGSLSMKRDTLLIGDLAATFAEINGKIKGNIDVAGRADLKADAVVFGDINASTITVEDGAVIQGRVDTVSMTKDGGKDLFPDIVVIGEGY
jgi:cytoskeletal protein CcmA (bactofilin family)